MKKLLLSLLVSAGFVAPAFATLQLSADINGTVFNCADQAACDTNPFVGQLQIANMTINGVEIVGSSQFQTIGPSNALNTSSFQIINHNMSAATIQLAINGIDFLGPVQSFSASGAGTWQNANGSSIDLSYYGDATNTQGANTPTDLPGLLLASFTDIANGPADSFSFNKNGPFIAGAAFGMSLGTSGTLAAFSGVPGTEPTLVGRSQTILATNQPFVVPEPGTLMLLGAALLGLCAIRRRT
jgi:hypothetical protein